MSFLKYSLLVVFFLITSLFAQNKHFTIEDVVINSYSKLAPKRLKQLKWLPNSNEVSFVSENNLVKRNVKTGTLSTIIEFDSLLNFLSNAGLDSKLKRFPSYNWIDKNTFTFWNDTNFFSVRLNPFNIKITNNISLNGENRTVSPNNKFTAYTIENNLFVSSGIDKWLQITNHEDKNIVSGQAVSRSEFGITNGIFWSPKSNYLAFYQKDESNVTDYPLVEIGDAPAKLKNIKYPMAGQSSEIVKVGVYNISENKTIWLETGEPNDQYLTNVSWDPSEKYIYIAHLNRDQNHMRLIKYNVNSGEKVKILFEETDNEYVEPEHTLQFVFDDPDKFIWFSERDGWQHLYLYNTNGKLLKQITKGNWIVKNIVGVNEEENELYFIGTKDSPIEDHLYKVNLVNYKVVRLTEPNAYHRIKYNKNNNLFIDSYSSLDIPSVTQIIDSNGKTITGLNKSSNPLLDYKISRPKIFTLKTGNDIDLYCRIILPTDFDSTKSYPVIVYVYGGPHAQLVTNRWYFGRYDFWFQYMAQNGYIVFTIDNRGSDNRGLEFEQSTFRHLGTKEIEDQLVGINYLKSLSYVDSNRIGVFGWSYGGFMTTSLMLRTNDTYKVGVGGGAVIDWKYYEIMYTERYMDTPETNPEGYEEASLLNYVDNLNGKLLLVHGTSDPVVVWEHTLEFAKKTAHMNKPLDYFPYVGHGHGVRGKDAIHLYNKISNYFFDNL